MTKFTIQTGGDTWYQHADTPSEAVIKAFMRSAPKIPGQLTLVREKGKPEWYVDTIHYLKKAGYKVE